MLSEFEILKVISHIVQLKLILFIERISNNVLVQQRTGRLKKKETKFSKQENF